MALSKNMFQVRLFFKPMRIPQESTPIRTQGLRSFTVQTLALLGLSATGLLSLPAIAQQKPAAPPPDVVIFKNGDKLTGALEREIGGNLIFKSDSVGEVTVSMDKVKELHTNGNFVVLKKDEKITRTSKTPGSIAFVDESISIPAAHGQPVETIPNKDVAFIIDQATYNKEVTSNPGPFQGWAGSATGGITILQSTSYGQTYTAALNLIRLIPSVPYLPPRTRSTVNVLETYGKLTQPVIPLPADCDGNTGSTAPAGCQNAVAKTNIFHADAEHDKYLSSRFYVLGDLAFDHNYSQGLDFQQIYGGGAGFTAIKDTVQELDFKGDIHYERQNFIQYAPPAVSSPNQNLIGSTFGEAYTRMLPAKIALTQGATYIQSWNVLHAYSAIGSLGLALPVYHRFSLSVNLLDNYLNNPAYGYQKNSLQFITGVTYAFK